jgi:hypothetical protein
MNRSDNKFSTERKHKTVLQRAVTTWKGPNMSPTVPGADPFAIGEAGGLGHFGNVDQD